MDLETLLSLPEIPREYARVRDEAILARVETLFGRQTLKYFGGVRDFVWGLRRTKKITRVDAQARAVALGFDMSLRRYTDLEWGSVAFGENDLHAVAAVLDCPMDLLEFLVEFEKKQDAELRDFVASY